MLVISRKKNEAVQIGPVKVTVTKIRGGSVQLGVEAPRDMPIYRPGDHEPTRPESPDADK